MGGEVFGLPFEVQFSLGVGYLAYCVAYASFLRNHTARHTIFISFCFSAVALLIFQSIQMLDDGIIADAGAVVLAILGTLGSAIFWRKWGRNWWMSFMKAIKVYRGDDNLPSSWDRFVDEIMKTDQLVGQISVHTKNGHILYLDDRTKFEDSLHKGLYLEGDGSIFLVVERTEIDNKIVIKHKDLVHKVWGTKMTYIPAAEIERVNIRVK